MEVGAASRTPRPATRDQALSRRTSSFLSLQRPNVLVMALVTLPVDAPIAEMFDVVRRDGGISKSSSLSPAQRLLITPPPVIRDFLPAATIDAFNSASAPLFLHEQDAAKLASGQALTEMGPDFHASSTLSRSESLLVWALIPDLKTRRTFEDCWGRYRSQLRQSSCILFGMH